MYPLANRSRSINWSGIFKNSNINKNKRDAQVYLGPSYNSEEILSLLKKYKLKFTKPKISSYIAKKISDGFLIGFKIKMEFTHRALGNRSILADPRKFEMQKKLTQQ